MASIDNEMLLCQFGAAIDMLGNALRDYPEELREKRLWEDQKKRGSGNCLPQTGHPLGLRRTR